MSFFNPREFFVSFTHKKLTFLSLVTNMHNVNTNIFEVHCAFYIMLSDDNVYSSWTVPKRIGGTHDRTKHKIWTGAR